MYYVFKICANMPRVMVFNFLVFKYWYSSSVCKYSWLFWYKKMHLVLNMLYANMQAFLFFWLWCSVVCKYASYGFGYFLSGFSSAICKCASVSGFVFGTTSLLWRKWKYWNVFFKNFFRFIFDSVVMQYKDADIFP